MPDMKINLTKLLDIETGVMRLIYSPDDYDTTGYWFDRGEECADPYQMYSFILI